MVNSCFTHRLFRIYQDIFYKLYLEFLEWVYVEMFLFVLLNLNVKTTYTEHLQMFFSNFSPNDHFRSKVIWSGQSQFAGL